MASPGAKGTTPTGPWAWEGAPNYSLHQALEGFSVK